MHHAPHRPRGLLGGAALVAALTASPASAASGDLAYFCDTTVGDHTVAGPETATLDSGIPDGLTVQVGTAVSLDPFTGTLTLDPLFPGIFREAGLSTLQGTGVLVTTVKETGDTTDVDLAFGPQPVPEQGPVTLQLTGQGGPLTPKAPGTHTLLAGSFQLSIVRGPEVPDLPLNCALTDTGATSIDAFTATTPTPTPTVTPTATPTAEPTDTPVRPVVVQTDFAGADDTSLMPLAIGGALVVGGVGALLAGRARAAARRH